METNEENMRVDIGAYRVQMAAISCFQGTLFDKNSYKTNTMGKKVMLAHI